jgi:hypothetical protein
MIRVWLLLLAIASQSWSACITGFLYVKDNNKEYIGGNYSIESTTSGMYTIKLNTAGNTVSYVCKGTSAGLNFSTKQFIRNQFIPELTHNYYWTIGITNPKPTIKIVSPRIYCYTESFLQGLNFNYRLSTKTFTFYTK